jgi:hypothetical protein
MYSMSDNFNGDFGHKRKYKLMKPCNVWIKQFKKIQGSQFVSSQQLGLSIGTVCKILG